MTQPTSATPTQAGGSSSSGGASSGGASSGGSSSSGSQLVTQQGKTSIADSVVQKIAGIAAREVSGVHNLGGSGARTFGAIRERIPGSSGPNISQGVSVEVGERQAAIDIDIVVEYGVSIADLAQSIRKNVVTTLERMTGLQVTEVNVNVDDIYIPGDDEKSSSEPARVQ
ncbi:MAG: Asp23/Gls24 family envelope stress response protein [Actinomycetota bacterium]|nr:Asp23/Gls24 family envelope stress response protein [Actinomycetota bacterium]